MKHRLRLRLGKCVGDHRRIAAIAEHRNAFDAGEIPAQVGFDGQQGQLIDFEQADAARAMPRALPAQFGANRTARPRHQHRATAQPCTDRLPVRIERLPAQQILDRHFLQLARQRAPFQDVRQARYGAERHPALLADAHDVAHGGGVQRRNRNHQQLHAGFACDVGDIGNLAQDRQALQAAAAQGLGVVQKANRLVAPGAAQIAHQRLACLAGAQNQHTLGAFIHP